MPVRNRCLTTKAFITHLMNQDHRNFKCIIVDDGSTDDTPLLLESLDTRFKTLRSQSDLWWAGSINFAFRYLETCGLSESDLIMIINDDVVLPKNFLSRGVDLALQNADSFIGANYRTEADQKIFEAGITFDPKTLQFHVAGCQAEINMLSTKGLIFTYRDIQRVGSFTPKFLPHYFSDYEWTFRAHKRGLKLKTFDTFNLLVDNSKTGLHDLSGLKGMDFVRALFSKRYVMNPIYFISFAWKTGGLKSMVEIFRVVYRVGVDIKNAL